MTYLATAMLKRETAEATDAAIRLLNTRVFLFIFISNKNRCRYAAIRLNAAGLIFFFI